MSEKKEIAPALNALVNEGKIKLTKLSVHGLVLEGENLENLLANDCDGLTDLLHAVSDYAPAAPMARQSRGNSTDAVEETEESWLASIHVRETGKQRFKNTTEKSRVEALRDWFGTLSEERRAEYDAERAGGESAAPAETASETPSEVADDGEPID